MKTKWSRTYIVHKGRKVYLNNTFWDLKEKLDSKETNVLLNVSGLFSDKEKMFRVSSISDYGRV